MVKNVHTLPPYVIYGFFTLGLISAIAFRMILVLEHLNPAWVRPAWYLAVCGNIFFFFYRFHITRKRKGVVRDMDLVRKIGQRDLRSDEDWQAALYIVRSTQITREDFNYAIIFVLSLIAIAADILLSLY